MSEKGLTNISLKKINKSKVYQYISVQEKDLQAADRSGTADGFIHSQPEPQPSGAGRSDRKKTAFLHPPAEEKQTPFRLYPILKFLLVSVF